MNVSALFPEEVREKPTEKVVHFKPQCAVGSTASTFLNVTMEIIGLGKATGCPFFVE